MTQPIESPRPTPQIVTDRQILEYLTKEVAKHSRDGGYKRQLGDVIVSRFAELIENQESFKRVVDSIHDAHALALKQVEFAQSAIRQLEKRIQSMEHLPQEDGESQGEPEKKKLAAIEDRKGK
jgi:hypothetical protein